MRRWTSEDTPGGHPGRTQWSGTRPRPVLFMLHHGATFPESIHPMNPARLAAPTPGRAATGPRQTKSLLVLLDILASVGTHPHPPIGAPLHLARALRPQAPRPTRVDTPPPLSIPLSTHSPHSQSGHPVHLHPPPHPDRPQQPLCVCLSCSAPEWLREEREVLARQSPQAPQSGHCSEWAPPSSGTSVSWREGAVTVAPMPFMTFPGPGVLPSQTKLQ